jgi:Predicted membrane protein
LEWLLGLAGSTAIAGLAYARKSLSLSGFMAAVLLGTTMYALGSAVWYGSLIAFFVSSTLWSKWKRQAKKQAESGYEKSGRRDAGQVLANGGLGLLLCAADWAWPHPLWLYAFLGVMASVTADTWATEIGGLSRKPPRSIKTGRQVAPGTSGGVSGLGLGASLAGGLFIGAVAGALSLAVSFESELTASLRLLAYVGIAGLGGLFGSLADSWIGATWQHMYRCQVCGREIEQSRHCEKPADRIRGRAGWNNDAVNFASSLLGGLFAVLLALVFSLG